MNSVHDFYKSLFINRGYKKEEKYSIEECLKAYNYGIPNYYTPNVSEKDKDKEEDKRLKEKGLLKKKIPDAIDFQKAMVKDGILNRIKSVIKLEEKVYGICDKLKKDYSIIHLIIKGEEGKEVKPKEYNELINKINENLGSNEYFSKRWISHVYGIEIGEKKGKWHMHLMVFCLLDYEVEDIGEMRIDMGNWILNCVYWIYQMLGGGYIDRGIREYHISTARMRYPERCYVNRDNLSSRINGILYLTYTCKLDKYTKKKMKEDRLRLFGVGINNRYRQLIVDNSVKQVNIWVDKNEYIKKEHDYREKYRIDKISDMLNTAIEYSRVANEDIAVMRTEIGIPRLSHDSIMRGLTYFNRAGQMYLSMVDTQISYSYCIKKQRSGFKLIVLTLLNVRPHLLNTMVRHDNYWSKAFGETAGRGGISLSLKSDILEIYCNSDWSKEKANELMLKYQDIYTMDESDLTYQQNENVRLFGCIMRKKRKNKNA